MALLNTVFFFAAFGSVALADTCRYIQAQAGDGCYSLAQRCGITESQLEQYNSSPNFCSSILVGQYVCCSAGSLPNFSPQPLANGTCYTYTVKSGDTCSAIATSHQMKATSIPGYNKETWGFSGCTDLQVGQNICLSSGTPPFPSAVTNAICGPQKPGTQQPSGMKPSNWTNLNPCPLNACCDKWGQCGITTEFCTQSNSSTGAPGTSAPNTNGCISNCGTDIINNENGPQSVMRVGYFEAWNMQRPCLNMDVSKLQGNTYYTHVHWAFANLTESWAPDVSGLEDQFNGLLKLTGVKRILSFGGWSFSTSPYTFSIFRSGVQPANRATFAKNVVNFIVKNNLDGVDFDWEYPGAQDIPGIPPDSTGSGANYLAFLQLVRSQLPSEKSLSIAAPASYWYLKGFPIKEIAGVVDYIIYMTYDLHGQWDYGNKFSDPGCPTGGCLRSQTNVTETQNALSMITKAGVKSTKIVAGLPLYGRSFQMVDPSCTGPECHFTGPASGAQPGPCTQTAGYISNFEIEDIIAAAQDPSLYGNSTIQQFNDQGDVLIYDTNNYVSWLTTESYAYRRNYYYIQNFLGTSDWAIDLQQTYSDGGNGAAVSSGLGAENFVPCDYTKTFATLDDLKAASGGMRTDCLNVYTLGALISMLQVAYANYTTVNNGYDALFSYYVEYINNLVPEILENEFIFDTSSVTNPQGSAFPPPTGPAMKDFNCQLGSGGTTIPCTQYSETSNAFQERSVTTNMILTNKNGYQAALVNTGLSPDWVVFGDWTYTATFESGHGGGKFNYAFSNAPTKNSSMVVPNPKDIITSGIGNIPDLITEMQATLLDMMIGQWTGGSTVDPATAYSTPVFVTMQAVQSMAQAKQLAQQQQQQDEEKERDFIVAIVSAVLFFVPIIGDVAASAAGFADLASAIAIAGELGNAALSIYNTVTDPSSAVVNILGLLFGVGSLLKVARDGAGIASVAKIKAAMSIKEVSALGEIFQDNNNVLQDIMKVCKAA